MDNLLKIVKESGINFTGSLVGKVLGYGWLMLITRFLTPTDFGTFTLAQSIVNISLIFVLFGTPRALDRFIPYYNAQGEEGKTKTLIQDILRVTLILAVIVAVVLFLGSGLLSKWLFHNPLLATVLKIMIVSIPLLALINIISSSFVGYKELRYQVYFQQLALPLLKLALAAIIFGLGYGLLGWTVMYILALIGTAMFALWFFREKITSSLAKVSSQSISLKEIVSYAWPLSAVSLITIVLGQIDFIFLGIFRPSAEVGIYKVYFTLVAVLQLGLGSLARIYKPVISELIGKRDFQELRAIYQRISKWYIAMTFIGFLIIVLLGKNIVSILFTTSYAVTPIALYVLATTHLMNALTGPDGMTLQAYGHTKLSLFNTTLMLITNVVLDILLIPTYGILGAAVATAVGVAMNHLAGLIEIYRLQKLHPFSVNHLRYLSVSLIAALFFYFGNSIIGISNTLLELVLFGTLMIGIYLFGAYLIGALDEKDLQILGKIKAKFTLVDR